MNKYTVADILKIFIGKHPKLYHAMNHIDHAYSTDAPNKFHLEGSIWTHTMMVLKEAQRTGASDVMLLSALCHDIGKAFVHQDIDDKQRRRFSSHEAVSTFYTKEVLESFELDRVDKERIMYVVANHGSMYNFFEDGRIPEKFHDKFMERFTYYKLKDLAEFYRYDHEGRFFEVEENDRCNTNVYDDFDAILKVMYMRDVVDLKTEIISTTHITILIGTPRAGKSTWVKNNVESEVVISRDEYVESKGTGDTYSEKWSSLTPEQQKEIDKSIERDFRQAIKYGQNIVVDMTNMSKKSRRKWTSNARGYHKRAKVFIESPACLLSRNTPDKFIPLKVTESMMRNFVWPQYDEFDHVEVYHG